MLALKNFFHRPASLISIGGAQAALWPDRPQTLAESGLKKLFVNLFSFVACQAFTLLESRE